LLSKQPGDAAQQRELLQVADEELERIEGWIDDAIQMSSRQAAELRLNKARHPIGDVIARAIEGLGPQTDGRSIDVEVPGSMPSVSFDAELIEKVIRQLVDNAIKYSPPGSPIRIRAEYTGAELLVHVADSGCGIPRDEQRRIFEKYYRGRARVSGAPGTGLGLASAKCIMEVHGGEIWVHSVPGSGSIFHISLPVELEASPEQCENLERRR
jgi:two-component system, OmpR family, sensor histidine kinase KdpD